MSTNKYKQNSTAATAAAALVPVSHPEFNGLKYYGNDTDPLIDMDQLLSIIGDVKKEDIQPFMSPEDYVIGVLVDENNEEHILLRDSGVYMVLYRSNSEAGKFFRLFIRNLLRKLRESHPELLIETFNQTREELAMLRVKYKQQANDVYKQQAHIERLQITTKSYEQKHMIYQSQNKILQDSVKTVKYLNTDEVVAAKRLDTLMKICMSPVYIYIVPKPRNTTESRSTTPHPHPHPQPIQQEREQVVTFSPVEQPAKKYGLDALLASQKPIEKPKSIMKKGRKPKSDKSDKSSKSDKPNKSKQPKPIKKETTDEESEDEIDIDMYSIDFPPEETELYYYMVSKTIIKKNLVCIERMFKHSFEELFDKLEDKKVNKMVYYCTLDYIKCVVADLRNNELDNPNSIVLTKNQSLKFEQPNQDLEEPRSVVSEDSNSDSDSYKKSRKKKPKSKPKPKSHRSKTYEKVEIDPYVSNEIQKTVSSRYLDEDDAY